MKLLPALRLFIIVTGSLAVAAVFGWLGPTLISGKTGRPLPQIGGPFTMVDHNGRTVTDADYRGRVMLVFFGFTHCPDICPTTLTRFVEVLLALGPDAARVAPLLVTVDPERDTVAVLRDYVPHFDPRITGLTGTPEQVAAIAKAYAAYYRKAPTDDGYTMEHTGTTYVMDAKGRFATTVDVHEAPAVAVEKIRRVLQGASS